ncbi:MAG: acylneuraminate cytidylyltransferase [Actinobacteria bacterium]|nr:acylneuraminate cytidylyltransferase [Actinomycetota bacterium]
MGASLNTVATAFIPVRAGSKGIAGKNLLPIAGRPLVDWVIGAAMGSDAIERVVVSTDDPALADHVVRNWPGVMVFERSAETATDTASTESAMSEYLRADTSADPIALLQATSPLTTSDDVTATVGLLAQGFDSAITVVRQLRFQWVHDAELGALPVGFDPARRPRRQDHDGFLVENGAIYVTSRAGFMDSGCRVNGRVGLHEMAEETYFELDEVSDAVVIDHLLRSRTGTLSTPPSLRDRTAGIRLVISDVDGCLTDNGMYYGSSGEETKRFSARDGKGFELLRNHGIMTMLLTSEIGPAIERRAEKLQVDHLVMASCDKVADADRVRRRHGLEWNQVAFLGDDIQDAELLGLVGISACPTDATSVALSRAIYHCSNKGGHGAFRELADLIVAGRNDCSARP